MKNVLPGKDKKHRQVKSVSMQSIADAVGVARSTVSIVLNGKQSRISEEVAQKIRETAKQMDYQINELARSLRTGNSRTIALVVADISDTFFGTLAYHFQEYAEEKGYMLVIVSTGEKKERIDSIFKMLINRQVDGFIVVPVANIEDGVIEKINPNIPMVFIDRYFQIFTTSRVIINNYEISKMATQLLIGKGCKRIVIVLYRENLMHMEERKRGFIDALSAHNLYESDLICEVDYLNYKDELETFLIKKITQTPAIDGIFMATGGLSSNTIRCLVNAGVKLQSDIQLIGFDRMDVFQEKAIPYIKQPMAEMCKNAFEILLKQMESGDKKLVDCQLSASIVTEVLK